MTVLQFPVAPFCENLKRHMNDLFREMGEKGLTQEQQQELLVKSLKEIGAVEIDGVWRMPGEEPCAVAGTT